MKLNTHLLAGLHVCSVLGESHLGLRLLQFFLCVLWQDDLKVVLGCRK